MMFNKAEPLSQGNMRSGHTGTLIAKYITHIDDSKNQTLASAINIDVTPIAASPVMGPLWPETKGFNYTVTSNS